HVVIVRLRLEKEGGLAVHFRGDRLHFLLGQVVCIQHDDGGVAAKALTRERIDVESPAVALAHEEKPSSSVRSARWRKRARSAREARGLGRGRRAVSCVRFFLLVLPTPQTPCPTPRAHSVYSASPKGWLTREPEMPSAISVDI